MLLQLLWEDGASHSQGDQGREAAHPKPQGEQRWVSGCREGGRACDSTEAAFIVKCLCSESGHALKPAALITGIPDEKDLGGHLAELAC